MSGEKVVPIVVDADALARAAAEVIRREGEAYAALRGMLESSLDDQQRALCGRVEARQRALRVIEDELRQRLVARLKSSDLRIALARETVLRLADHAPRFRGPPVPARPSASAFMSLDLARLEAIAENLEASLIKYEAAFATSWSAHCAAESVSGRLSVERDTVPGSLCYAAAVVPMAERREAAYAARVRSLHQAERIEAEAMLRRAEDSNLQPSQATIGHYRRLLESDDLGRKRWHKERLKECIRADLARVEAATAAVETQKRARSTVQQKAVIADLCRQMNWEVVLDPGEADAPIYVAEAGFRNHLRKLQLSTDGSTLTTIPVEIRWEEPLAGGAEVEEERRSLDRAFCGEGGSALELKARSGAAALRMGTGRRTGRGVEHIDERALPQGLRARHRAEVARRRLRGRPLPGPHS